MRWTWLFAALVIACGPDVGNGSGGASGSDDAASSSGASQSGTTVTTAAEDTSAPLCIPGQSIPCTCTNGDSGAQVCTPDGTSYGPCTCDSSSTSTTDAGTTAADESTTDAGSTGGVVRCLPPEEPYPDFAEIHSAADIPALAPYSVIAGKLTISGAGVLSLEGMECLEFVGGQIYLGETTLLTSLAGLENLQTVQGEFEIGQNGGLADLSALTSLTQVGYLSIYDNNSLDSVTGLTALTTVDGGVGIDDNPQLPNCDAFALIDQLAMPPQSICVQNNLADACPDQC